MTKFVAIIVTDKANYAIGYSSEEEFTKYIEIYGDVKWAKLFNPTTREEVMSVESHMGKLFNVVRLR